MPCFLRISITRSRSADGGRWAGARVMAHPPGIGAPRTLNSEPQPRAAVQRAVDGFGIAVLDAERLLSGVPPQLIRPVTVQHATEGRPVESQR